MYLNIMKVRSNYSLVNAKSTGLEFWRFWTSQESIGFKKMPLTPNHILGSVQVCLGRFPPRASMVGLEDLVGVIKYNAADKQKQRQKPHDPLNRCRECLWSSQ
jgi:hypothetical protein